MKQPVPLVSDASRGSACGSLNVCIHAGSFPESSKVGGWTIGTDDPSIWQHLMWFDGQFWAAELKSDTERQRPATFEELKMHFDHWRDSGQSPWRRVYPQPAPLAS